MKRILVLLMSAAGLAQAGVPSFISHEGRLLRADGTPERGTAQLTFRLYDVDTGGAVLWSESQTLVLSTDGYYATFFGRGAALPAFDGRRMWLGITVQGETEMTPRAELAPVPYAVRSSVADRAFTAQSTATVGASTGQWLRLAQGGIDLTLSARLGWENSLTPGCCGRGEVLFRAAKRGNPGAASQLFFQVQSQFHENPAAFTRIRLARDVNGVYVDAFVPSGFTPARVTVTALESSDVVLTSPAYASGSPTVDFDSLIQNVAFSAGAGDPPPFAVINGLPRIGCSTGTSDTGAGYCIDSVDRTETGYASSFVTCAAEGKQVCTFSQLCTARARGDTAIAGGYRVPEVFYYPPNGNSYFGATTGSGSAALVAGSNVACPSLLNPVADGGVAKFRCCRSKG